MAATIKDVARMAGVSFQAVSSVLNGNLSTASAATRQRILSAVSELNYRPNRLARALVSGKTSLIGVIVPEFISPFYADLNRELQVEADRRDLRLMIVASSWDEREAIERVVQVADYAIDGLLLMQNIARAIRELGVLPSSTPIVVLGGEPQPGFPWISYDYLPGIRQATAALRSRGCRDIVFLHDPSHRQKSLAWRQVCAEIGAQPRERHYLSPEHAGDASLAALGGQLAAEPLPDAFLVASDYDAAVIMRELARGGFRIPDDVSLVSMDDTMVCRLTSPALSTIRLDRARLARLALDMIYEPDPARAELIPTELVVRDSVRAGPPPKRNAMKPRPANHEVSAGSRSIEVRKLLALSVEELIEQAGGRLVVTDTLEALYDYLAQTMVDEFARAAAGKELVSYIMPVGPTQPYRRMAELVNLRNLSLANARFFFMDDYCDDRDRLLPESHPLSFRGQMRGLFFDRVRPELLMPPEQVIFPDPDNVDRLAGMIERAGGIEICYGGIGIHGHVAFNEPQPGVALADPRVCDINDFTRTIDSARHKAVGGNLVNFPRRAVTLGMRQCLGARRMLLMTRNESTEFLWANTVLRIAALGAPGDDYPVTHARNHPGCVIATDRATAEAPRFNL